MKSTSLLSLRILTPEGAIFEKDDLVSVRVLLVDGGSIGIRSGHAPLIAETVRGSVDFRTKTDQDGIELFPGVLDIRQNVVTILTAGLVSGIPESPEESEKIEFDRLMATLARQLELGDETNINEK